MLHYQMVNLSSQNEKTGKTISGNVPNNYGPILPFVNVMKQIDNEIIGPQMYLAKAS